MKPHMTYYFRFDICGLQGGFTLEKGEQQCNDYIRHTVGRDKIVLMLVNGGAAAAGWRLVASAGHLYR
ncbi:putative GMP synthase [Daphnia magna]|uniref:Putative GMP synthase n=1 Tax=Daphnia magna TaxID=35525 RepID=A0A164G297_9CRUS|nr:putative GMP synthase [Daphnia magna]